MAVYMHEGFMDRFKKNKSDKPINNKIPEDIYFQVVDDVISDAKKEHNTKI